MNGACINTWLSVMADEYCRARPSGTKGLLILSNARFLSLKEFPTLPQSCEKGSVTQ